MERETRAAGLVAGSVAAGGALGAGLAGLLSALPPATVGGWDAGALVTWGLAGLLGLGCGGAAARTVRAVPGVVGGRGTLSVRRDGLGLAGAAAAAALVVAPVDPVDLLDATGPPPTDPPVAADPCVADRAAVRAARLAWVHTVDPTVPAAAVETCHDAPSVANCWVRLGALDGDAPPTQAWLHLRNVGRADGPLRLAVTGDFATARATVAGSEAWGPRLEALLAAPPAVVRFSVGHDPSWSAEQEHAPVEIVTKNAELAGDRGAAVVLLAHRLTAESGVEVDVVARISDHASTRSTPGGVDPHAWDRRIELAVTGVAGLDAAPACQE